MSEELEKVLNWADYEQPFELGAEMAAEIRRLRIENIHAITWADEQENRADKAEAKLAIAVAILLEADEALTDMGWHTDRGLLNRIRTVLDLVAAEEKGRKL